MRPSILGIDAGGTMTDCVVVDEDGAVSVGKAPTTPRDESEGLLLSLQDALGSGGELADVPLSSLESVVYSGTSMLNILLERKGRKVGLLITRGLEDYLLMERGIQTYLGYHYADRLHAVTHVHNPPLIPRRLVCGIPERIDMFGREVIPLYEHEVRRAVEWLIEAGVEAICVCFTFSFANPSHEQRARELALEVLQEAGVMMPVYTSSGLQPVMREYSRFNCTVIEAYAGDPARAQYLGIEEQLRERGYQHGLQVMSAHGGVTSVTGSPAFKSLISGPIGGLVGARYTAGKLGLDDIICTDMGGTSFDVGLITGGMYSINPEPELARFKLNLPMVALDSIGAGTGTVMRVDPVTGRVDLGPESMGAEPGPVCYGNQRELPTICDCDVITGLINPDYYLGGTVKLDVELARHVFKEKIADPLGLEVDRAAAGMIDLVETQMRDHLYAMVLGRGYETMDYYLMAYGGSGPLHVAGYSRQLPFSGVLVPSWAPCFSAYGCACARHLHRYDRSTLLHVPVDADDALKLAVCQALNGLFSKLKHQAVRDLEKEGFDAGEVELQPLVCMRYTGQLDSLEVPSRGLEPDDAGEIDSIVDGFEEMYRRIYARAALFRDEGYLITEVVLLASVETPKPRLEPVPLKGESPGPDARKGERDVYWDGGRLTFPTFEMDLVEPGNEIRGPAIVEAPATTMVVPPGQRAVLDSYRIFHLEKEG